MKLQDPANEVTVVERNRPYDTFGWGVVFSDATMQNPTPGRPRVGQTIVDAASATGMTSRSTTRTAASAPAGTVSSASAASTCSTSCRRACEEVGVKLVFETSVQDDQQTAIDYDADLVIASRRR